MLALISIYFRLRLKLLQSALVGMLAMHLHSKMKNKHSLQIRIIFAAIGPTLHLTMFPFLPGLWRPWVGPCMPLSSGLPSTFTGKAWCFFKTISYWIHQIWFWRQEAVFKQAPLIGISCCLLSLKAIVSFLLALFVALNKKKTSPACFFSLIGVMLQRHQIDVLQFPVHLIYQRWRANPSPHVLPHPSDLCLQKSSMKPGALY